MEIVEEWRHKYRQTIVTIILPETEKYLLFKFT